MELRELIKRLIISYPIIYGCSIMATFVFCLVFDPDSVFGMDYLGKMFLFALAGDLPSLVFYSKRELSHKEQVLRKLIHLLLLEGVLLTIGRIMGLHDNMTEGIFFFFIVLAVYLIVWFLAFSDDLRQAKEINKALEQRKKHEDMTI